ncbi:MAG: hypothetical protein PVI40_00115 [Chlamydiota bacterium]|jgi:hypothetical protein
MTAPISKNIMDLPITSHSQILSFLPFKEQMAARKINSLWNQASQTLLGQFALIQSTLSFTDVETQIFSKRLVFFEELALQRFNKKIDPSYAIVGKFLSTFLRVRYSSDPGAFISFLSEIPEETRKGIPSFNFPTTCLCDALVTEVIRLCPNLKYLNLSGNTQITGECLASIPNDNQLEHLVLGRCSGLRENFLIEFFSKATLLKKLDLESTKVTGEGLSYLPEQNSFEELYLGSNYLVESFLEKFFIKATKLKKLYCSCCEISGKGLSYITGENLESVFLYYCDKLEENFLKELFANGKNLKEISLSGSKTTGEGLSYLPAVNRLEQLSLNGIYHLNENFLRELFSKAKNLKKVNLSVTRLKKEAFLDLPEELLKCIRW